MKKITSLVVCSLLTLSLTAQDKPELVITTGHILSVKSCAYHPQGNFIATGSDDNSIKIWDLGLKQEFRTLTGHSAGVRQIAYTSDGKYIVSMDDSGNFLFWDAIKGDKLFQYKLEQANDPFSISPNSNAVLVKHDDTLRLFEIPGGKQLKSFYFKADRVQLLSGAKSFAVSKDSKGLAQYSFEDTEHPIVEVKEESAIFQDFICVNEKENIAAMMSFKELVVIDLAKKAVRFKFPFEAGELTTDARFTSDGKKLLFSTTKNKIKILNTSDGKIVRSIDELTKAPSGLNYSMVFALMGFSVKTDNTQLAFNASLMTMSNGQPSTNYATLLYNIQTGKLEGKLLGNTKMIRDLALTSDNKYLCTRIISSKESGMRFWNLKDGSIVKNIPAYESNFSKSGKACYWYAPDSLVVFNTSTFEVEKKLKLANVIKTTLSDDGRYLLAITVNTLTPNKDGLHVYETSSYKQIGKYTVDHHTFFPSACFSPDGNYIIGTGRYQLEVMETNGGKKISQQKTEKEFSRLIAFIPNTTHAIIAQDKFVKDNENTLYTIDYKTGELISEVNVFAMNYIYCGMFSPDGKTLALGTGHSFGDDYDVIMFNWETKQISCRLKGHINAIQQLTWHPDGNTLYSSSLDGTAKVWDVNSCSLKGSLVCMNGPEEYIIYSPEYFYKSSKGNYDGICFRYKSKLYGFDQFDLQLNRPDIVMEKLGSPKLLVSMYKQAWKKRIRRMGFTEEGLNGTLSLPETEIENKETITANAGKVKFKLKAKDETYPINRINVYVNNIPVYGLKGMNISAEKSKTSVKDITLDLSAGENKIDVSVVNERGLESARESFVVDNAVSAAKPDLHIFVLTVARFKDAKHNLTFPVKDGKDFVAQMRNGNQFANVEVTFIQDSMATRENILAAAKALEKAKVNDQVMVFVSSHGLLDSKLDYFIATHDVNFEEPAEKGLPYEDIENIFNKVAARNRLILIDACHSGEVDKESVDIVSTNGNPDASSVKIKAGGLAIKPKAGLKNSFAYMQALFSDVSRSSGATVISAAGGNEFALESKEWNNGVFTYSILKGLQSNAADLNKDKLVKISELKSYVIDKVSELTGGKQTPTARKENEMNDFVIFKR